MGNITDSSCSSFYRIGRIDRAIINVKGPFSDYDMEGNLYFQAAMYDNKLEGPAKYYYKNGVLKEEGAYSKDLRNGKWTYYYPDGQVEKIYNFSDGLPYVVEAYTKKGKATVSDGNGRLKTHFSKINQCDQYETWGNIVNGRMHGRWTVQSPYISIPVAHENYENGKFIQGRSRDYDYTNNPLIELTRFSPNENLRIVDNSPTCPGQKNIFYWKYKGGSPQEKFYPELQFKLSQFGSVAKDQWVIAGIRLGSNDAIEKIDIASSVDDTLVENFIYNILSDMKEWETMRISYKKVPADLFFSILVSDNKIIIPTHYIYQSQRR